MNRSLISVALMLCAVTASAVKPLNELQQNFVDLKFGLFIHFGMGTFLDEDWADPDVPVTTFDPKSLDCRQWIDAARQANMKFGCMSVKHHNGFCMWDTETTPYNAVSSPAGRDVVKEFTDALHEKDMAVMFHFSILDLHEKILPNRIQPYHADFIKAQLRELLTNYGPVTALMIDGWDAPWSRISYEDISFQEIYDFVKSIQPECLVMDLNGAKYPGEALFYSDIKTYEQGAGQKIEKEKSFLPSMACYPIQDTWFWKSYFPDKPTKPASEMVNDNLVPMNEVCCTYILNVAPNRDGLLDENAVATLREIGRLWHDDGVSRPVAHSDAPIVASNIAKGKHVTGSWSDDCNIHDLAADDNFGTGWISNRRVAEPWLVVELGKAYPVNAVAITEAADGIVAAYRIECRNNGVWTTVFDGEAPTSRRVKINRFDTTIADAVRLTVTRADGRVEIKELGVFSENR